MSFSSLQRSRPLPREAHDPLELGSLFGGRLISGDTVELESLLERAVIRRSAVGWSPCACQLAHGSSFPRGAAVTPADTEIVSLVAKPFKACCPGDALKNLVRTRNPYAHPIKQKPRLSGAFAMGPDGLEPSTNGL